MNAACVSRMVLEPRKQMEEDQNITHILANDCAIDGKQSGDQENFRGEFDGSGVTRVRS